MPAALGTPGGVNPLPDAAALEGFFAACYQASMLRQEERLIVFRAILAEPALFALQGETTRGSAASRISPLDSLRSEGASV